MKFKNCFTPIRFKHKASSSSSKLNQTKCERSLRGKRCKGVRAIKLELPTPKRKQIRTLRNMKKKMNIKKKNSDIPMGIKTKAFQIKAGYHYFTTAKKGS